jgi:hypothetical protein
MSLAEFSRAHGINRRIAEREQGGGNRAWPGERT